MRFHRTWIVVMVVGCGPVVAGPGEGESEMPATTDDGDTTGTPGTSTSGSAGTTSPGTSAGPTTTTSPTTSTTDASSGESGPIDPCGDFIGCPDFPTTIECDVWLQDCPVGQKCMPWAADGGTSWNGTRCSEIVDDPDAPGESCTAIESGVSGSDTCDGTSMCFGVDPETLEGTCHAFCTGSEASPMCANECDICNVTGDGVLTICIPTCDPLEQNCADGSACYLGTDTFICVPDGSGASGAAGDECEYTNACDGGLACMTTDWLPDCTGVACCTPFCTVGDPSACAVLPGTDCLPVFEDGGGGACVPPNAGICGVAP